LSELKYLLPQDTQAELVLLVIRTLAEEVRVFHEDLPDKRRKDLQLGVNASLPVISEFLYRLMSAKFAIYKQSCADAAAAPSRGAALRLLNVILATLSSLVDWAPMRYVQ
jgi:hypothetical protein